jgi:hypothetical protein
VYPDLTVKAKLTAVVLVVVNSEKEYSKVVQMMLRLDGRGDVELPAVKTSP